jgi:CheY-like chemotaxis protein
MTSILGYTDLISEAPDGHKLPAESALALQTIRRNGEHLLGLINDILDLSKIESGNLETEAIRCSLSELMNEVTRTMGTMAKGKNLKFGVEYATKIPREIRTDPTRLKQILFNVIGNSLKFTKNGSVTVTVRYETSPIHFVIDIADTGIGLTEEQRKGLFRPFSQADASTTRQYGGTGLGLSISRYLAEALGGSLVLHHTEPGVGSCFRLCIQADYPSESEWFVPIDETQKNNVAAGRTTKSELELAGLRILVAEDGLDNQRLIRHILSKRGATVEVVENGALAVQRVQEEVLNQTAFDVVLMDMQMPVMDGYAATATLRSQHYQLPVIALTANAMHGDREKCLKAGCSDFATKPIDRTALIAIILNSISDSSRSHTSEVTKS